ncbi:MAG: PQQ-dependent sugar dehydrogenase, partial [Alphaproteobacteria bacterium]|nr:PQQ-dependent sugar dehydrogenase [Alphaproteobacteria bacterium]
MRFIGGVAAFAILTAFAISAEAQQSPTQQGRQTPTQPAQQTQTQAQAPRAPEQVARPGGRLDIPQLALVKVADGFQDPTSVAAANDGSGRIFVTERVGRVRVVDKDGAVMKDPFLDLTKINPLGSDVQTGFVEQGLYSIVFDPRFRENGHFYVHYASLPFNGDNMVVRFTVDPASPNMVSAEQANRTAKVILRVEQPWYNHNGGQLAFGPKDGMLYI